MRSREDVCLLNSRELPRALQTRMPSRAPLPRPRNRQEEENRAIELVPNSHCCPVFLSQDPKFQKHATQILRNMLRQEERELQVRPLLRAAGHRQSEPSAGVCAGHFLL